jgi:hypothetical protein
MRYLRAAAWAARSTEAQTVTGRPAGILQRRPLGQAGGQP